MIKVIGAGFGRTGTHSLATALEILGFRPCYHMLELQRNPNHINFWSKVLEKQNADWQEFFQPHNSTVEWPAVSFLSQILAAFPEAKLVLTLRDPDDWYESAADTIFDALEISLHNPNPDQQDQARFARRLILRRVFSNKYKDNDFVLGIYKRQISSAIEQVPREPLLLYCISEGWESLCAFMEIEPPGKPLPWVNKRAEFMASEPEWAKKTKRNLSIKKKSWDTSEHASPA